MVSSGRIVMVFDGGGKRWALEPDSVGSVALHPGASPEGLDCRVIIPPMATKPTVAVMLGSIQAHTREGNGRVPSDEEA